MDFRDFPEGPSADSAYALSGQHRHIRLDMWTADAVVLFDWLEEVDVETLPISHQSQRQALRDLVALLEVSVVPPDEDQLWAAQADVARDMDR